MTTDVQPILDTGPLDWRIGIVDTNGRPTPEFQRRWNTQRQNNGLITPTTVAVGAPVSPAPADGSEYVDIGASPPALYVASSANWIKVGVYSFLQLSDVPHAYTSSANKLVQVNTGATGLVFTDTSHILDTIGAVQGDLLYRSATSWSVLAPGTAGQLLSTGGAGTNPAWESITTAIDTLGSTQGDVLYRSATGWTVLAPGTSGNVLTTGGTGANPSWAAGGGGGGGAQTEYGIASMQVSPNTSSAQTAGFCIGTPMLIAKPVVLNSLKFMAFAANAASQVTPTVYSSDPVTGALSTQLAVGPTITGVTQGLNKLSFSAPLTVAAGTPLWIGIGIFTSSFSTMASPTEAIFFFSISSAVPPTTPSGVSISSGLNASMWLSTDV